MSDPAGNQKISDQELERLVDYACREEAIEIDGERVITKRAELWISIKKTAVKVGKTAKREKKETIVAAQILKKFILKKQVTDEEKKFLKEQSIDIARILPLVAVQAVPAPIPITPFLIALGSKIGINLVPKEQKMPGEKEFLDREIASGKRNLEEE